MTPRSVRRAAGPASGLSVLEVAVATTIFAVVLAITGAGLVRAHGAWRGTAARVDAERRGDAVLERVVTRLTDCGGTTITGSLAPPTGASTITFREVDGWNAGAAVWGAVTTLAWEPDPQDAENGRDDDGDGLVDEGQVVWRSGTGSDEKVSVLVQGVANRLQGEVGGNGLDDNGNGLVDERGLSFDRVGPRLTIRLTLERLGADGVRVHESRQATIRLDG